jgi:hypothetical protein
LVGFAPSTQLRANFFLHVAVSLKDLRGGEAAIETGEVVAVPAFGGLDTTDVGVHSCKFRNNWGQRLNKVASGIARKGTAKYGKRWRG